MAEPGVAAGSLLERDAALRAIVDAQGAVSRGNGATVFVQGAAGIGKTSLIDVGRLAAQAAGFRSASAVGSPTEARLPFGLFGQAIVALGGSAIDDAAELARLGGQPARLYRTLRFFAAAAAKAPLILVLDDLHWADADSLALLGFLCRRLSGTRILVVGSLRPEPDAALLMADELVGSGHARLVALEPLSRAASAALLAGFVSLGAAESERVVGACAGSPLLLKVAGAALSGGVPLPQASGEGRFGRSLLLERFVGLGPQAFGYVHAASILGVRFRPALAGALAGLDRDAWEGAHARLLHAGLLDDLGAGWTAFVHPLFVQALVESRPPSERERAEAEAFRLLVERGEPDAVAAEHAVAARLTGDPLAVKVTARAGREALAQGALGAARSHLASAVELAGEAAGVDLLHDYAEVLAACGEFEATRQVCAEVLGRPELEPAARNGALALLARVASLAAQPAQAERLYEEAVAAAGDDPALQAVTLADAVFNCHVVSPIPWVLAATSRALDLLDADAPLHGSLETLRSYLLLLGGDPAGAELLTREAAGWVDRTGGGEPGWAWMHAAHTLGSFKLLENLSGATELFDREFSRAVEDGAPILINTLAVAYADVAHRLGRPREALELVQRASAMSDLRMSPWYELAMAVLLTEFGRDEEAAAHLDVLRTVKASMGPAYGAPVSLWLDVLDARRLLAVGEPAQASMAMLDAAHVARSSGWREPCIVPWAGVGIEAHLAAGRNDLARALIEDLECLAQPLSCRWPRAVVALGRAGLAASEGRHDDADRRFAQALAILDQLPLPIAQAEALTSCGAHLRRSGRPRQARAPLARALELAERTGSERVARLARAELAASGGRRRRRSVDRCELTAQERRVAALAADGMTNAQIAAALHISPKTAGHHLEHIYAKLGVRSRRELTQAVRSPASG